MGDRSLYVEIIISAAMNDLWRFTQTPELHERWDLRFTHIEYLPRPDPARPQEFRYATRIGFGLCVEGRGESVGEHAADGTRSSALRFWSDDRRSLIREGSGYWKYIETPAGLRFLTRYDYETRHGALGRAIDRVVFRPLLGWATAWSFDRLRLWLERGVDPSAAWHRSVVHAVARLALATIWLYQGLVPKLLFGEVSGEVETVAAMGLFGGHERLAVIVAGAFEIAFGAVLLALWQARVMLLINIVALLILGTIAAFSDAGLLVTQFNPVALNLAMIALGLIGWLAARDLPSAGMCLRREPERPR